MATLNEISVGEALQTGIVVRVELDDQISEPVAQSERAVNTAVQGMVSSASIAEAAFRGLDLQVQANGRTMSRVMNENGGSGQIIQATSAWDRLAARFDDATKTGNRLESAVRAIDKASASLASTMNTTDLTTQETLEINRQAAAVFAALNAQLATAAERYTALQVAQKAGGVAANYTTPVPPTLNEQERANNLPLFAHFGQTPVSGQFETQEGQGSLFPNLAQTFSPGATDPKQLLLFGAQEAARRKQQAEQEAAALVKDTATANTAVSSFLGGSGGPPLPITPSSGQGAGNVPAYGQRQEDLVAAQAAAEKLALTYDHDAASAAKLATEVRNIVAVSELLGTEKAGRALNAAFDEYVVGAQKAEKAIEAASAAEARFLSQAKLAGTAAAAVSAAADQRLGAPRTPTGLSATEAGQVDDAVNRFTEKQNQINQSKLSPDLEGAAQAEALKQFHVELDAVAQAIERTRAEALRLAQAYDSDAASAAKLSAEIKNIASAASILGTEKAGRALNEAFDAYAVSAQNAEKAIAAATAAEERFLNQSKQAGSVAASVSAAADQRLGAPRAPTGLSEAEAAQVNDVASRFIEKQNQSNQSGLSPDLRDAAQKEALKQFRVELDAVTQGIERTRAATERMLDGLAEKFIPGINAAKQFAATQADIQRLLEAGRVTQQQAADITVVQAAAYDKLGASARAAAENIARTAENARLTAIGARPELVPGQSETRQADVTAAFAQGDQVLASLSPAQKDAQELEAKLEQIRYAERALGTEADEAGQMRSAAYKAATAGATAEAEAAERARLASEALLDQLQAKYAPAIAAANNYAKALQEIDSLLQRNKIDETQAADAVLRETEARDRLALSLRQEAAARQLNQGRAQIEAGGPGGPPGNLPPDDAKKLAAAGATVLEKSPNLSSTEWQQQIEQVNVLAAAEAKYAEQHQRLEVLRQAGLTTPQDAAVAEARYAAALDEVKKKTDAQGQAFTALQAVQTRMNAIRESGRALTTAESAELNNATLAFQKTTAETEKGARSFAGAGYATSGLTRELVVMTHELSQGNISRFAGSVLTTTEYLTAFRDSLFSVGRALFTTTAGLASLGAVAVIGGITLLISQAHSASATLIDLQNSLRATREDYLQLAAAGAASIHDITTPTSGVLANDNRPALSPQQIITTTAKTSRALLNQSVNDVSQATDTNLGNRFLQTDGSQADAKAQNEQLLRLEVDIAAMQKTTLPESAKLVASAYTDATAAAKKFQSEGLFGVTEELVRTVQRQQDLGHNTEATRLLLNQVGEAANGAADKHTKLGEAFQRLKGTAIDLDAPMRGLGETVGRWLSDALAEVITRIDNVIKKLGDLRRSFPSLSEIVLGKPGSDFLHSVIDAPVDPNAKLPSGVTSSRNSELDKQLAYLHAQPELADLFTPSQGRQVKIDMTRRDGQLLPDSERGRGVFQITPPTARGVVDYDTGQSFVEENAAQNIVAGMKLFDNLFKQFKTQIDQGDYTGVIKKYIGATDSPQGVAAVATRMAQIQGFTTSDYEKLPYATRTGIDTLSDKFYHFNEQQRRIVQATAANESGGFQFVGPAPNPAAPSAAEQQKAAALADQIVSGRGGPEARIPVESTIQRFERDRDALPPGSEEQVTRYNHAIDELRIKLSNLLTPFEEATRASKEKLKADTEATTADEKLAQAQTALDKQTGYAATPGQREQRTREVVVELNAEYEKQERQLQVTTQATLSHTLAQGDAARVALALVTNQERATNADKAAELVRHTAVSGTAEQTDQLKRYTNELNLASGATRLYALENDNTANKQQRLREEIARQVNIQRSVPADSAAAKDSILAQEELQKALNSTKTATEQLADQQAKSIAVQQQALPISRAYTESDQHEEAAAHATGKAHADAAAIQLGRLEVQTRATRAFDDESRAISQHTQSLIAQSNALGLSAKGYSLLTEQERRANEERARQTAESVGEKGTPEYQRAFDLRLEQLNTAEDQQKLLDARKGNIPVQQRQAVETLGTLVTEQAGFDKGSKPYLEYQGAIEDLTGKLYKLRTATEEVSHTQELATARALAGTGAQLTAFTAAQTAEEAARNEGKKAEEAAVIGLEAKRAKLVELTATFESQLATEKKANDLAERGVAVLYQQYLAYGNIAAAQEHLKNLEAAKAEVLAKTASAKDNPAEVDRQVDLSTTEKDRKSQINRESALFPDLAKQREAITLEQAQIGALSGSIQKTNEAATAQKAKQELADKGFTQETALTDEYIRQAGVLGKLTNEYNFRKSSIEAVTNSLGQAFDQLGQSMSNAFLSGQSAGVNFHNAAKALVSSLLSEFAKLAVINPILNSLGIGEKKPTIFGALDALSGKQPAVSESRLGPATAQEIAAELEKSRQQQQQLSGPMNVTTPQVTINATGAVIHSSGTTGTTSDLPGPGPVPPPPPPLPSGSGYTSAGQPQYASNDIARAQDISGNNYTLSTPDTTIAIFATSAASLTAGQIRAPGIAAGAEGTIVGAGVSGGGESGAGTILVDRAVASSGSVEASQGGNAFDGSSGNLVIVQGQGQGQGVVDTGRFDVGSLSSGSSQQVVLMATESVPQGGSVDASGGSQSVPIASPGQGATTVINAGGGGNVVGNLASLANAAQRTSAPTSVLGELGNVASVVSSADKVASFFASDSSSGGSFLSALNPFDSGGGSGGVLSGLFTNGGIFSKTGSIGSAFSGNGFFGAEGPIGNALNTPISDIFPISSAFGGAGFATSAETTASVAAATEAGAADAASLGSGAGFATAGSSAGATIGATLGGAGLGFAGGSLLGTGVQSLLGKTGPGPEIGAAIGAAVGAIFGPVGALIGGLIGGAGGGLIGPKPPSPFSSTYVGVTDAGQLHLGSSVSQLVDTSADRAAATVEIAKTNAILTNNGLRITDVVGVDAPGRALSVSQGDQTSFQIGQNSPKGPIDPSKFADFATVFASFRFAPTTPGVTDQFFEGHSFASPEELDKVTQALNTFVEALKGTPAEGLTGNFLGQVAPMANTDIPGRLQQVQTFVTDTVPQLTNTGDLSQQIAGLNTKYAAAIDLAHQLGYAEQALTDARASAIQKLQDTAAFNLQQIEVGNTARFSTAYDTVNAGVGTSFTPGNLRAQQATQLYSFDNATAPQARKNLTDTLVATYGDAYKQSQSFADEMALLEKTLGEERLALVTQSNNNIIAATKASDTASFGISQTDVGLNLRYQSATDTLNSGAPGSAAQIDAQRATALATFDLATAPTQRKQLTDQLTAFYGDAYTSTAGYAAQLALLEKTLGQERLAVAKSFDDQIAGQTKQSQNNVYQVSQSLLSYARNLGNSVLSPQQQYANAQQDFQQQATLAQGGDFQAIQNLTGYADTFISTSRALFGSGAQYFQNVGAVLAVLNNIATTPAETLTADAFALIQKQTLLDQTTTLMGGLTQLSTLLGNILAQMQISPLIPGRLIGNT